MLHHSVDKTKMLHLTFIISAIYSILGSLFFAFISVFLSKFINNFNISLLLFFAFVISFICSLKLIKMINKKHTFYTTLFILSLTFISSIFLWLSNNILLISLFSVLLIIGLLLLLTIINLFLEEFTNIRNVGLARSINLIINHAAIIVGLITGGYILKNDSEIHIIFALIAFMHIPLFYIFKKYYKNLADPIYRNADLSHTFQKLKHNKDIKGIVISALGVESFFTIISFFLPLYLITKLNIDPFLYFSVILPVAMLPYLILPFILEELSEHYGEKEMLIFGYMIIFVLCALIPFIESNNIIIWAVILILTRVGTSIIDTMNNIYFYKKIHYNDIGAINIFTNTKTIGSLLGTFVIALTLFIINDISILFFIYLIFGVYILSNLFKIKDTK